MRRLGEFRGFVFRVHRTLVCGRVSASTRSPTATSGDLQSEVAGIKAKNAALKEQLRRVEEQQKACRRLTYRIAVSFNATIGAQRADHASRNEPVSSVASRTPPGELLPEPGQLQGRS
jgi:hypothetical protein